MIRRAILVVACGAALPSCGGGADLLAFESPADRAFVADGAAVAVRVRADGAYEAVRLDVGGEGGGTLDLEERDPDGAFAAELALPAGRHRIVASVPDVPGLARTREVFVARAPDAPVDGFGIGEDGAHAIVLSGASPADDGLYEGRLTLFSIATAGDPVYRVLAADGVFGEVSAAGRVAWVDGWSNGAGTLHAGPVLGEGEREWDAVRSFAFAPDGETLAALDEGVVVFPAGDAAPVRVAPSSRVFVFSGPGGDLASFDGLDGEDARRLTVAAAPDYVPVVLAPYVRAVVASNPARREAAFLEYVPEGDGALLLYDYVTRVATRPFASVAGFSFSRDGDRLLALADPADEGATVAVLPRDVPGALPLLFPGTFVRAGFDHSAERVFAVSSSAGGLLFVAHLDDPSPAFAEIASGVVDFLALPGDRMLLLLDGDELALVGEDDAVLALGAWNDGEYGISLSADFTTLAFTAVEGDRRPIRRVDLATGHVGDLGQDASLPAALGGGAVAWAERRGDGTHDLWMLPTFPASVLGPRRIAGGLDAGQDFALSFDATRLAAVADDRVLCVDAGGHVLDLGPADDERHAAVFLPDGRLVHFGRDGGESRVLFFRAARP